jgi:aspartyl aminopeptidase
MDSEDQMMMHLLMAEEANAAIDEQEHLMILVGLLQLEEEEKEALPKRGGSECGEKEIEANATTRRPSHGIHQLFRR